MDSEATIRIPIIGKDNYIYVHVVGPQGRRIPTDLFIWCLTAPCRDYQYPSTYFPYLLPVNCNYSIHFE